MPFDDAVSCYQKLVYDQLVEMGNSQSILNYMVYTDGDIGRVEECCINLGYTYKFRSIPSDESLKQCNQHIPKLLEAGVLVKLGTISQRNVYTTLHADLVFRILRGRAFENNLDGRWVGRWYIQIERTYLPDFKVAKIGDLEVLIANTLKDYGIDYETSSKAARAIVNGLEKAGYRSLATWQFRSIESILRNREKIVIVDAPTASGKTLVFTVPIIVFALLSELVSRKDGASRRREGVLLVYPRKALQRQQLEELLRILYWINSGLKELGAEITVAVDKGLESREHADESSHTLLDEITIGEYRGKLVQKRRESSVEVVLEVAGQGGLHLTFFKGIVHTLRDRELILGENPHILITNPWTIKERVKSLKPSLRDAYLNRNLIVLDEVHVYTNINYLELVATLKHYRKILLKNKTNSKFILSSATIPLSKKEELASWLLGICQDYDCSQTDIRPDNISLLEYEKLEPPNNRQVLKILVTLLPYRLSIETIVQGVIQVLSTALVDRKIKALLFVDSISEVSTLTKYIETIFEGRNAVEICDHLLSVTCRENPEKMITRELIRKSIGDEYSDYSWSHLWNRYSSGEIRELLSHLRDAMKIIEQHHGALPDNERKEIEQKFAKGHYKILLTTSTLDLGMNFEDVSIIVQYKEPSTDEALIQRIGRAGRKDESYRIALGFYIPLYTPIHLQALLTRKRQHREDKITFGTVLLPHPSVINKIARVEEIENEIKYNLYLSIQEKPYGVKLSKLRHISIRALTNLLMNKGLTRPEFFVDIEVVRENLNPIYKEIKSSRNEAVKLLDEAKEPCTEKESYLSCIDELRMYIKRWLRTLNEKLESYGSSYGSLNLITETLASEELQKFHEDIRSWINDKPRISLDRDDVLFNLPKWKSPYCISKPSEFKKPDQCKKLLEKINRNIELLVKHVEKFDKNVKSGRELIAFISAPRAWYPGCDLNEMVDVNNYEKFWYLCIRNPLLEYLRLYSGLTTRSESDRIELEVR